ncbi:MAG: hypothetical protein IPN18_04885 [Ignavibacteriales bacterium]|nr:hypothetical protein [Ignavibacteriales bacterium]
MKNGAKMSSSRKKNNSLHIDYYKESTYKSALTRGWYVIFASLPEASNIEHAPERASMTSILCPAVIKRWASPDLIKAVSYRKKCCN